ncbi:probable WRKY transcription factor 51, partial [Tanacetum coccineum]
MFSSVSHTNLRPSHQQTQTNISSPKNYSLDMNYDQACEFTFEEIFDNYQTLIDDHPGYKDSTHSNSAAHFGVSEQNRVFQEKIIADDQVCSLRDFATHNSTNQHNSIMHKSITNNGSTSKHSATNVSLKTFTDGSTSKSRDEMKTQMLHRGLKLALRMKTKLEVVYDGYKWRKYGKKKVKSSPYP